MPEPVFKGGCRWMSTFEHSLITVSERRIEREFVTCCNCQNKVAYTDSWVSVPYGVHGNLLPLPVFIFCWACSLVLDAQVAYQDAYRRDQEASLPDPVKLARQEALDKEYGLPEDRPEHEHL